MTRLTNLIDSPMLPGMKKNDDGSLTLFIQKNCFGADKASNWLPAPDGPIYLVVRLYWPKTKDPFIKPLTKEEQATSLEFFNIMNFVLSYLPLRSSGQST